MKYIVTEIQSWDTGAVQTLDYAFDEKNQANSKYHEILSVAAKSKLPYHACIMYTNEGNFVKSEGYEHIEEDTNELES